MTEASAPADLDLYLFSQGRHQRLWEFLGARPDEDGVTFRVWAPHAREVRVVGDFAGWAPYDGVPLSRIGDSGVWSGHVAGAAPSGPERAGRPAGAVEGHRYKYRVHGADGIWRDKADPMATRTECPPANASVVWRSRYEWGDADWLAARRADHHARPMSVYEVHLGSWRPGLGYVEVADQLVEHVTRLGFTHVELLPVMEHPYGGSWGYQVTGYYAPTARFGTPDEFRYLVDRLHQAGIGVLLDWVPAHFPRDEWALARFDGTPLYEHPDPRRGEHPDWGSLVFDFGRPEVRNFLIANALYWFEQFHIDGLRVDAVASLLYLDYSRRPGEWEPNVFGGNENLEAVAFLRELNATVYAAHPGVVMIAEESTAWPGVSRPVETGGLGFGLKWNMGWMHDTLDYVARDPVYRRHHHGTLTLPSTYAFDEQYVLPISHDEVVHGKRSLTAKLPGDRWARLAGLRGLLGWMWGHPGKKLLFMGAELADEREWSEQYGLDWSALGDPAVRAVGTLIGDLNRVYRQRPALWSRDADPSGFEWLVPDDADGNLAAILRRGSDASLLVVVSNFAGVAHLDYRLPLPAPGHWVELVNTDAVEYGGTGVGNLGSVVAEVEPYRGHPATARISVGPLSTVWLAYQPR
ncbi:MAG TPA: 1,4-alpha-glucan branching protein GlgB [Micromonosporaceae bacterium]